MNDLKLKNNAIIVLGMHRSGTSAISGVLSQLNIHMGNNLFAAQKNVNEKGFFENAGIVDINDNLFDLILSSWDDPLARDTLQLNTNEIKTLMKKAKNFLLKEYSEKVNWGMKDPRTSILLPFWQAIFKELDLKTYYVIMLRHPLEVYASLNKRDNFSLDKSLMIWLNYTLYSYYHCYKLSYKVIKYDDLMSSPQFVLSELINEFDKRLLKDVDNASLFISQKLRNHKSADEENQDNNPLQKLAISLYNELSQVTFNHQKIEEIKDNYSNYKNNLDKVLIEHLQSVKEEEVYFRTLFYKAYTSLWWKVAWPLKKVENFFKKSG